MLVFTSNLLDRINEHRNKRHPDSFSSKYNLQKLVYHESFHRIEEAIIREKRIKGWIRLKKVALIESLNKDWKDLYDDI